MHAMKTTSFPRHSTAVPMAFMTLVAAALLCGHVTSGASSCQGGRSEGDKWFDGCRWCVCENSRSLCSSSECSELNARIPPCQNVGSRWWDGCYRCSCRAHGIECRADSVCVALLTDSHYAGNDARALVHGACVEPQDDRCVCGVDGVPSCTADAIDWNALQATTISLDTSSRRPAPRNNVRPMRRRLPHSRRRFGNSRRPRYSGRRRMRLRLQPRRQSRPSWRSRARRSIRRASSRSARKSGRIGRWRREEEVEAPRPCPPLRRRRSRNRRRSRRYRNRNRFQRDNDKVDRQLSEFLAMPPGLLTDEGDSLASSDEVAKESSPLEDILKLEEEEAGPVKPRTSKKRRRRRNYEFSLDEVLQNDAPTLDIPSLSGRTPYPPSLLVTTDNRCRWGPRWYGGGLRCHCDEEGSITCGDPSFVANQIDGFVMEKTPCEEGHAWEERDTCRYCECRVNGAAMCRRAESCPPPFLITPVEQPSGGDDGDGEDVTADNDDAGDARKLVDDSGPNILRSGFPSDDDEDNNNNNGSWPGRDGVLVDELGGRGGGRDEEEDESRASSAAERGRPVGSEGRVVKDTRIPLRLPPRPTARDEEADGPTGGSTQVRVVECRVGRKWMDGCLLCSCEKPGKKHCDDRQCLKAIIPTQWTPSSIKVRPGEEQTTRAPVTMNGRVIQVPPGPKSPHSSQRTGPVQPAYVRPEKPCGRFSVGQIYWSDCNRCWCLRTGPRCTAINC